MIQYNGIVIKTHPDVYKPSKDTFLLADNLDITRRDEILEIGTGTGLIAVYSAQRSKRVVATDIDEEAIKCALQNVIANRTYNVELKNGNLFEPVQNEKYDLILFNTYNADANDKKNQSEDYSKSREIIDKFILELNDYLNEGGRFQIVQSSDCDIEKTISKLEESGFVVEIKAREKILSSELVLINGKLEKKT
jgi:release factor glutamine methyltransferase